MKRLLLMVAFILGMAVTFTTQAQDNRSTLLLGVTKSNLNLQGKHTLGVNIGVLTHSGFMVDATLINVINNDGTEGAVINGGYDILKSNGGFIKSFVPFVGVSYLNTTLLDDGFSLTAPSVEKINLNLGIMTSVRITKNLDVNLGYGTTEGAKLGLGFRFNSK